MNEVPGTLSARGGDGRRLITNIYISIMFLLFPLFVGFHGYEKITASKFYFFVIATVLWLAGLVILSLVQKKAVEKLRLHHIFALCFMGIVCISALISPYGKRTLLGAGRYDGLFSQLLYALIFLGVSLFGRPKRRHFALLGISAGLCCLVAVFQLFDINLLGLFPGDYSYYDKGIRYSGEFLGTMGNTNVLSELLCLALPILFILPVIFEDKRSLLCLIPLFPAVFVTLRANVSGGIVALGCCALIGAPIVLSSMQRLRRALLMLAYCLVPIALALAFQPEYSARVFSFSFRLSTLPVLCLILAAVAVIVSIPLKKLSLSAKALRGILCAAVTALVIGGLVFVYLYPFSGGTLSELRQLLHGRVADSFGSSRILIWRECLGAWLQHPILGHGPDTVGLVVDIDFSRYVEETGKTLRSSVDNAHNIYLGYLVNTGLAGAAAYVSMLLCGLIHWLRRQDNGEKTVLGLALLCSAVQGFFALGLCLSAPIFWIMLGLLLSPDGDSSPA